MREIPASQDLSGMRSQEKYKLAAHEALSAISEFMGWMLRAAGALSVHVHWRVPVRNKFEPVSMVDFKMMRRVICALLVLGAAAAILWRGATLRTLRPSGSTTAALLSWASN